MLTPYVPMLHQISQFEIWPSTLYHDPPPVIMTHLRTIWPSTHLTPYPPMLHQTHLPYIMTLPSPYPLPTYASSDLTISNLTYGGLSYISHVLQHSRFTPQRNTFQTLIYLYVATARIILSINVGKEEKNRLRKDFCCLYDIPTLKFFFSLLLL